MAGVDREWMEDKLIKWGRNPQTVKSYPLEQLRANYYREASATERYIESLYNSGGSFVHQIEKI